MVQKQNFFDGEVYNAEGLFDVDGQFFSQLHEDLDEKYVVQIQEELDIQYAIELLEEDEQISVPRRRKIHHEQIKPFASDCVILDERKSKLESELNLLDYELVLVEDDNVCNDHYFDYEIIFVDDGNVGKNYYNELTLDDDGGVGSDYDYELDDDNVDSCDLINDHNIDDDHDHISQ